MRPAFPKPPPHFPWLLVGIYRGIQCCTGIFRVWDIHIGVDRVVCAYMGFFRTINLKHYTVASLLSPFPTDKRQENAKAVIDILSPSFHLMFKVLFYLALHHGGEPLNLGFRVSLLGVHRGYSKDPVLHSNQKVLHGFPYQLPAAFPRNHDLGFRVRGSLARLATSIAPPLTNCHLRNIEDNEGSLWLIWGDGT